MKISFIKYNKENYIMPKLLGINIENIQDPEKIDETIEKLKRQEYTTIIMSNELASFSENMFSKYKNDKNLNIIITPSKNKYI